MSSFRSTLRFSLKDAALALGGALCASLSSPPALAASGGGGAHGHEPHVANWFGLGSQHQQTPALGWMMFTFAVFVTLLFVWARRPLARHLESRSAGIRKALEEAQQARADAEARAAETEARLAQLDAEVAALKEEFRNQGQAEFARLEETARAAAARIAKDAEDTIQAETARARESLKAEGARLALGLAEERIARAMAPADQQRLAQAFIHDLSA